jgi:hypothetical protein
MSLSTQLGRAGGHLPYPRRAPPLCTQASVAELRCQTLAPDEEQAPKRERDGLSLARWNQEPYVSGANRV